LIWAFWHLPLFWIPGDVHHRLPLGWFLMQVIGSSILYAWMMNRTRGSLVLVSLFHAACNTAVGLLPILPLDAGGSLRPLWILLVLQWLVVGGIIAFSGSESQERNRPRLTSSANPAEG
jgi:membrane protease YdiL (CAAX protease family)